MEAVPERVTEAILLARLFIFSCRSMGYVTFHQSFGTKDGGLPGAEPANFLHRYLIAS